jgi:hypothetical protein
LLAAGFDLVPFRASTILKQHGNRGLAEVEQLTYVRTEIVRQIEQRREPLLTDLDLAREIIEVLENAYTSEQHSRSGDGKTMPEPKYDRYQVNALVTSAETLRDPKLLREIHEWEKNASRADPEINWEGRAIARVTSNLAAEATKERVQHFLDSKRVAPPSLGEHPTGTLRESRRTLTEYLSRAIESREQRDHRHSVNFRRRNITVDS